MATVITIIWIAFTATIGAAVGIARLDNALEGMLYGLYVGVMTAAIAGVVNARHRTRHPDVDRNTLQY